MPSAIDNLIESDAWSIAQGDADIGPFVLRYRTPILRVPDCEPFTRLLRIVWSYAAEDSGAMPSRDDSSEMERFENRLCEVLEPSRLGVLTAVLTFDGARQWIWYTSDVSECGARINAMPQESEPYPLQLDVRDDSNWDYLHDEILRSIRDGA